MQIVLKGKNIELENGLKDYTENKIKKLQKYFDHIIKVEVEFSVEKNRKRLDAIISARGRKFRSKGESNSFYKSLETVLNKLERQLKKYKEKLREKKKQMKEAIYGE